jgi:ABC-type polysaccharide/polyol phosphate export permease
MKKTLSYTYSASVALFVWFIFAMLGIAFNIPPFSWIIRFYLLFVAIMFAVGIVSLTGIIEFLDDEFPHAFDAGHWMTFLFKKDLHDTK